MQATSPSSASPRTPVLYEQSCLINVDDEKGAILDQAVAAAAPKLLLELGTHVGYSALRTARAMPDGAQLVSIEFSAANAAIAQRVVEHAGVADRVTIAGLTSVATNAAASDVLGWPRATFVVVDALQMAWGSQIRSSCRPAWLPRARSVG